MPKFKVVIYETFRHEVEVEAEDKDEARRKCWDKELDENTKDNEYYESEIKNVYREHGI